MSKAKLSKLSAVAILLVVFSSPWMSDLILVCNSSPCEVSLSAQSQHDKNSKTDGCCSGDNSCCCDKISISLLSDLPIIITPTFQYKVKKYSKPVYIHNSSIPKDEYLTEQLTPYLYKLPPKIPDIRVFIQSFII